MSAPHTTIAVSYETRKLLRSIALKHEIETGKKTTIEKILRTLIEERAELAATRAELDKLKRVLEQDKEMMWHQLPQHTVQRSTDELNA